MRFILQIVVFVFTVVLLLWVGLSLFGNVFIHIGTARGQKKHRKPSATGMPGMPKVCPVCSAKLGHEERVLSSIFPSMTGGKDRLMHIRGCVYCLHEDRRRVCPVCGHRLALNEILIARLFERPGRAHVHVLGCSNCKR